MRPPVAWRLQKISHKLGIVDRLAGPWGHRTPAAVTQAGYAYCQLRDTQLSVQTRPGHGPRDNGARVNHGRPCLGGLAVARHRRYSPISIVPSYDPSAGGRSTLKKG